MLDCWMALDLEYGVRMAERLRQYDLKWMEDSLIPDDFQGFEEMRRRLPWQTLATGEHWYTTVPFMAAAARHSVDIFQPDIQWVGGATAVVKICHIAEAAGISVIPHGGMNDAYGSTSATRCRPSRGESCRRPPRPAWPWGAIPGSRLTPGMSFPEQGRLVPSDAPASASS